MCNGVYAVIVSYNPDIKKISECIYSLAMQVERIVLVDNGSSNSDELFTISCVNLDVVILGENKGIAYAQNYGVEQVLQNCNVEYLFFSDQDTKFPENIIKKLKACYYEHNASQKKVACIAPFFKDHRSGYIHPSVYLNTFTSNKIISEVGDDDLFPSHVIASGMFIPKQAWFAIGPFDSTLFIDWVDTEWCWRAIKNNYIIVQTPSVMISHELGYGQRNFAGRSVTIHNSFRNYYKIRNAIYLMIYSDYSFKYRYHLFFHAAKNIVFEMIYSKDKINSIKVCCKSVFDAVLKRLDK